MSGHFEPLLPLAVAARDAGHTVAFASGDPIVDHARTAGFLAFEAGRGESFRAEWASHFAPVSTLVGDAQRRFFMTEIFANLELVPRAIDLDRIMSTWRPSLVVREMGEFAAPMISTQRGVPYADVGYGALIPLDILQAAGTAAAPHWFERGLTPHPLGGAFRHLYVDPCPPTLQNSEIDHLHSVQAVRPAAGTLTHAQRSPILHDLPSGPTVYVTIGTIWNNDMDVFRLVITSLRDSVNLIVTVGRQNDPAVLGDQPRHVVVRDYIPQAELLPWCDAMVTHGGSGTMLGALAHGVPLLVVPQGADQWSNAAHVVAAGAGHRLLREDLSERSIRDAVTALLDEPSYRDAASAIANEIAAMPTATDAWAALEALLARTPRW